MLIRQSLTRTGHEHSAWSPGAIKTAHCSWLPLRKDSSDGLKAEDKFHWHSLAIHWCVCVCVFCVAAYCTCVLLCVIAV